MCSNYQPPTPDALMEWLGSGLRPAFEYGSRVFPGQEAPILVRDRDRGDVVPVRGTFGMLPHWAKGDAIAKQTYNARSETVAEKPSFRNAWRRRQLCLVPVESFNEPEYGQHKKSHWMSVGRRDSQPFALAGIWETRREDDRERRSFSLLTINAAGHPLMDRFHAPGDEKRSVVVVPAESIERWLDGDDEGELRELLQLMPADEYEAWPRGAA